MRIYLLALAVLLGWAGTAAAQSDLTIQIRPVGAQIETSWADPGGVLEQADAPGGPWTRVPAATSPHVFTPTPSPRYFRLVRGSGGEVVGSFYTLGLLGGALQQIATPGVSAYLVNVTTLAQSPRATSDANGTFILSGRPPGHYQLCWEAPGFVSGCSTQQIALVDDIVYLAPEAIALQTGGATHALLGQVGFATPAPLRQRDAFFDIDFSTTIRLETGNGVTISTAMPNSSGQFILTNAPNSGSGHLVTTVENLSTQMDVDFGQTDAGTVLLGNSRPVISQIVATQNGSEVKRVAPGSTVQLAAAVTDPDADALHFLWVPSLSPGSFVTVDATNVDWTLPTAPGVYQMYFRASDGRGGYATARVRVSTVSEMLFTGAVTDSDGAPVANATASLGTSIAETDATGAFSLVVSKGSPPFVLTISKPGFAPISRVFADESAGGAFTLIKPEVFSGAAGTDISVTNSKGMELFIPANSLSRSDGLPVADPVTVAMTTVDPCDPRAESPVSTIAAGAAGSPESFMSSLSTAHVRLTDASGAELSPTGNAVTMALPISPACGSNYSTLPPKVGIWAYDLASGSWTPSGTAAIRPNPFGGYPVYQLTATAVNLNNYTAADPTGPYSIVNLSCDRSIALPFDVRVIGPSFAFTRTVFTVPTPFVLAPSIPVTFAMLDHRQAPGGHYNDLINPFATATPDTSKTVNLQTNFVTPAPFGTTTVTLKLGTLLTPLLTKVELAEDFLAHNFGAGDATTAANYYAAVDPGNQRTTLAAWKTLNGFNTGDEAFAVYFNAGDLGFGRRMHMKRKVGADSGTDVAFYVSNHDTVEHARTGFSPTATVAMEYAYDPAHPSHGRYTKFFVFDASDNRVDRANLDNKGDKFVPNLCQICHGGQHVSPGSPSTGWNLYAKFIPFDMESYTYSLSAAAKPGAQHNAFRTMNLAIRDNTSPTASITALINGWYGISGTGNFDKNFVPPAWSGGSDLAVYRDVVKPSCRACHTTRGLDFATPTGGVDFCGNNVCNLLVMPDAQRTFSLFWGSKTANVGGTGTPPNMPAMLSTRYGASYSTAPCP